MEFRYAIKINFFIASIFKIDLEGTEREIFRVLFLPFCDLLRAATWNEFEVSVTRNDKKTTRGLSRAAD